MDESLNMTRLKQWAHRHTMLFPQFKVVKNNRDVLRLYLEAFQKAKVSLAELNAASAHLMATEPDLYPNRHLQRMLAIIVDFREAEKTNGSAERARLKAEEDLQRRINDKLISRAEELASEIDAMGYDELKEALDRPGESYATDYYLARENRGDKIWLLCRMERHDIYKPE